MAMRFTAEIKAVTYCGGGEARVEFERVRRNGCPDWRGCSPNISVEVPAAQAKTFAAGRKAFIKIDLERLK